MTLQGLMILSNWPLLLEDTMGEKKSKQKPKKKKLNFVVRMVRQYGLSKSSITPKLNLDSRPSVKRRRGTEIVLCCYNFLNLLWENIFLVWDTCFPVKEGLKVCRERGHNLETEGREVADLFRDTAFDPEWNWKTSNEH